MDLIYAINQKLEGCNLKVTVGINVSDKEIRTARNCIYCNHTIAAMFQLIEHHPEKGENTLVLQEASWQQFLQAIEREFGGRFMRDRKLYDLKVGGCKEDF